MQYGGTCDADAHETDRVLIWGPPTPLREEPPLRASATQGTPCP